MARRSRVRVTRTDPGLVVRDLETYINDKRLEVLTNVFHRLTAPPSEGGTPVKTGHATSNWLPSEGSPDERLIGSPQEVDYQAQTAALLQTVNDYSGGPLFISNNVPYIDKLNNGSSTQAPAGFVEAAVEGGIQDANE